MLTTTYPSRYPADLTFSTKVFMPFLHNQLPVFFGQYLRFRQITDLHVLGFSKHNLFLDIEHGLPVPVTHVNVNRMMFIAVEEEPVSCFPRSLFFNRLLAGDHLNYNLRFAPKHPLERNCNPKTMFPKQPEPPGVFPYRP